MDGLLTGWLAQAPLALLVVALIAAGLGLPFPEDVVLLLAGALAHRTGTALPLVLSVCAFGVLTGDLLLFTTARRLGAKAFERPLFRRLLTSSRREKIEAMFAKRGPVVVFVARHIAGLRAPTFAMAGIHGMPLAKFLVWDALGMCISLPVVVGLGYAFSDHLDRVRAGLAQVQHWAVAAVAAGLLVYVVAVSVRRALYPKKGDSTDDHSRGA